MPKEVERIVRNRASFIEKTSKNRSLEFRGRTVSSQGKMMIRILTGMLLLWTTHLSGSDMETITYFQALPKAELHLHLGGSYPKSYLFSIATDEEQKELENKLEAIAKGIDYHEAFRVFQLINQIVNTEGKVRKGTEALALALQEDGVSYAEIRTGLKDLGHGPEAYLQAVLEGIQAKNSASFQAHVVLSLQRNSSLQNAKTTVDLALKYQDRGVIGMDISGDSTLGNIDPILPELLRAKQAGLSFVIHIGESPKENDQLQLLQVLEPKRIGHGVHLSSEAKEWILEHRLPVEVCLTSSVLVQMIERYEQHPGFAFFHLGHPIVFCTDDPLLFSTTLSKEFLHAHQSASLSLEEIARVSHEAFGYAL